MNRPQPTILPKEYFSIRRVNNKTYVYDGENELFRIYKIFTPSEFMDEYLQNEGIVVFERFYTLTGCYLYGCNMVESCSDFLIKMDNYYLYQFYKFFSEDIEYLKEIWEE